MSAVPARTPFSAPEAGGVTGLEAVMRMAYAGQDLGGLWASLLQRIEADPADAAALIDASLVLMVSGHRQEALNTQAQAVALRKDYVTVHGRGDALTVLALVTRGDFMANTPIDFLLAGSDITLRLHYVDAQTADLSDVAPHDVMFVAVGEAPENQAVLARLAALLQDWPGPILNASPRRIAALTRDEVCALLSDEPTILSPTTVRAGREILMRMAAGAVSPGDIAPGVVWPITVRPVGTHAGQGLERADGPAELAAYLSSRAEAQFYVAAYVDYAGADGRFRKQRIVFIGGRPYPSHFAVSDDWIVHYLSAGMAEAPERRAEEADWFATFDAGFAVRYAEAFAALHRRLGLDYFGIDCAELPDGRLLVFEADVAMIVHDLDPEDVFPYKKPAMRRLFAAFQAELARAAHP